SLDNTGGLLLSQQAIDHKLNPSSGVSPMSTQHPIVSRTEWLAARYQLWLHEKALTHQRDEVAAARLALPWVKLEQPYRFQGADGELNLADLFAGRRATLLSSLANPE
ncbi:DUF899 domain-containing protein, partial [Pseudomonas sp. S31]|nr:DUF899 domain-containing protein [Pseudomonas sp. S31]